MDASQIKPNAKIIGADGVPIGTVDRLDGHRIKIRREGALTGQKHFVDISMVAGVENGVVRLSASGEVVMLLEDEE